MYTLELGSRSGSYIALAFFSAIFLMVATAVWREIRRRAPARRRMAAAASGVIFIAPVALIYASSLNGFYAAEVRGDRLVLRYLFPAESEMPLADVEDVRVAPAFRGRWRLYIRSGGVEYESATWNSDAVRKAAEQLRQSMQSVR